MCYEKVDSGTIILNQKNAEIGTIKKIYSSKLARLELPNSDSVAFDPTLVKNISTSGRLLKKTTAYITNEAEVFILGATETLKNIFSEAIKIIVEHLASKEIKKALQHFEFDILIKTDFTEKIPLYQTLGLVRGIELAGKTPQDFLIKAIFQTLELNPELKAVIQPEIVVDRLSQEKAFNRILWNILRVGISQGVKLKEIQIYDACFDALLEIGLKHIEIEYKASSSNDILYWQNRIEECINKYIALMLINLEPELQIKQTEIYKTKFEESLKNIKITSNLKEQAQKVFESFNLKKYENEKTIELIHSGIKGFNLKVMTEKKTLKDLLQKFNEIIGQQEGKTINLVKLSKFLDQYTREIRDVSKEFLDILFEICQYLKKIEYGDSKARDFYANIMNKIYKRNYYELSEIMETINSLLREKE